MPHRSIRALWLCAVVAVAGCGGGSGASTVVPSQSGLSTVDATMQSGAATTTAQSGLTTSVGATSAATAGVASANGTTRTASSVVTASSGTTVLAINSGGSATGTWSSDRDYSGSVTSTTTRYIDTSHVTSPAPESVYQSQRYAQTLTYTIPNLTAWATYTVRLHFAEGFFTSTGQRVMNVSINGNRVLSGFDIVQAAGGAGIAVVEQFSASAGSSGQIAINLVGTTNNATIAGIEIVSGSSSATPIPVTSPTPTPSSSGWHNIFPGWAGNNPLPSHPTLASNSQAMMDTLYADSSSIYGPGLTDDSEAYWTASSSDPLHTVHCTYNWGANGGPCYLQGQQIHVPSGAVPAGNTDHHVSILQPDGCTVDEMWEAQSLSASTIVSAFAAQHNQCTENGFNTHGGGGTTAGGASNRLGHSPLAELQTGVIHHAIIVFAGCSPVQAYVGQALYPGQYQACRSGVSGPGIPMGAYLWSDVTAANLPSNLDHATRMLCTALNVYGGLMNDTNGNWYGIKLGAFWAGNGRSGEYPNGVATNDSPSGLKAWLDANAGSGDTTNPAACFPNGDWSHHIHVVQW